MEDFRPGVVFLAVCAALLWASPAAADGLILDGRRARPGRPADGCRGVVAFACRGRRVERHRETYVVQAGETLSQIAEEYGMTMQALAALNALADPDRVDVGQTLQVTAGGGARLRIPEGGELAGVRLWPWPAVQGQTLVVWLQVTDAVPLR